jgi:dual specificity tyrosine-phosphorylation-regulated kinase 2/3/4
MTPDETFKTLSHLMWEVEKRELFEYKTIYFFPREERKKQKNCGMHSNSSGAQSEMGVFNETTNNGFDNDQNEYIIRMNEHLGFRYEVVKKCGKGSFGVVLKCYDHK